MDTYVKFLYQQFDEYPSVPYTQDDEYTSVPYTQYRAHENRARENRAPFKDPKHQDLTAFIIGPHKCFNPAIILANGFYLKDPSFRTKQLPVNFKLTPQSLFF